MTKALEGGEGSALCSGRSLPPGKDPVPILQEAEWAPEPVLTGGENFAPTGIRFPDRPARSQSLYRLRYPAHCKLKGNIIFYAFFWVIPRRLNFICRRFGTLPVPSS